MPRALHEQWRCPTCKAQRHTTPAREAFCTDDFSAMEPVRENMTSAVLAFPELNAEQRRIDREMRTNRGARC